MAPEKKKQLLMAPEKKKQLSYFFDVFYKHFPNM